MLCQVRQIERSNKRPDGVHLLRFLARPPARPRTCSCAMSVAMWLGSISTTFTPLSLRDCRDRRAGMQILCLAGAWHMRYCAVHAVGASP